MFVGDRAFLFECIFFQPQQAVLFPLLTTLDVSNNCINRVPALLASLSSLSVLNLSGNMGIETLPPELGLLGLHVYHLQICFCEDEEGRKHL